MASNFNVPQFACWSGCIISVVDNVMAVGEVAVGVDVVNSGRRRKIPKSAKAIPIAQVLRPCFTVT